MLSMFKETILSLKDFGFRRINRDGCILEDPQKRISAVTDCLLSLTEEIPSIRWIGTDGSFWTSKPFPNDIDFAVAVEEPVLDRDSQEKILSLIEKKLRPKLTKVGLEDVKIDHAVLSTLEPEDWSNSSPSRLIIFISARDIYGVKPQWVVELGKNIPLMMEN